MKLKLSKALIAVLIKLLNHTDDHEQYVGDIEELYNIHKTRHGASRANIYLLGQVLRSIPFFIFSSIYWGAIMFKNHIKILFRSMLREKAYSLTNITGLTIGMICSFMIIAYVFHEISYDKYFKNADRIYRLETEFNLGQQQEKIATSNFATGFYLKDNLTQVEDVVHFRKYGDNVPVEYGDQQFFEKNVFYSENSVFNVFSLKLLYGNSETALIDPESVILSETTAEKYFGNINPVGKVLKIGNQKEYNVTGVFYDLPSNTHLSFNILCSLEELFREQPIRKTRWMGEHVDYSNYTYLLMNKNANIAEIESKFPGYVDQFMGNILNVVGGEFKLSLFPMKDIYLYSQLEPKIGASGNIKYVYIFSGIAILIMIIAAMNFINLSTAKYVKRAREVGLRKVLGSTRKSIIKQFLSESIIYCLISFVLSVIAVLFILPWYTSILNINLEFSTSLFLKFVSYSFVISLMVGLIAGFYPAIFLSSFAPAETIKGNMSSVSKLSGRLRYALVVFQFTVSIALIIGTIIIYQQVNFMKNTNLGFKKDHTVILQITDGSLINSMDAIKNELTSNPKITGAAFSSFVPGTGAEFNMFLFADNNYNQSKLFAKWNVDADFLDVMGIKIKEGRNFSKDLSLDKTESVIINETAVKEYELKNPIGNTITELDLQQKRKNIIGIVKDFHFTSLHGKIQSMVITQNPSAYKFLSVRIENGDLENTLAYIKDVWTSHNHTKKFEYYFLDEAFDKLYKREVEINNLLIQFTILAIFIACLGMAGLAAFTAEQRTKEIGVRKVMGASITNVISILTKQFIKWVLVANIFAWPIAYYAMEKWLENYPYRIELGINIFFISSFIALVISLITVGYQTLKAALANPADALKYE